MNSQVRPGGFKKIELFRAGLSREQLLNSVSWVRLRLRWVERGLDETLIPMQAEWPRALFHSVPAWGRDRNSRSCIRLCGGAWAAPPPCSIHADDASRRPNCRTEGRHRPSLSRTGNRNKLAADCELNEIRKKTKMLLLLLF